MYFHFLCILFGGLKRKPTDRGCFCVQDMPVNPFVDIEYDPAINPDKEADHVCDALLRVMEKVLRQEFEQGFHSDQVAELNSSRPGKQA